MRQGVVFNSRISKKVTTEDLKVNYKISEDELDLITKLYQAYKIKNLTTAPTLETFLKDLVFSNIEMFKEKSEYARIYSEVPKV
jgi:hypothetical protein